MKNKDKKMEKSENQIIIDKHSDMLMEHFDSVLIIATKHDANDNSAEMLWTGKGNMYANIGAVNAWLTRDKEETKILVKKMKDADDEDDEDKWKS